MLCNDYQLIDQYIFFLKTVELRAPRTLENKKYALRPLVNFLKETKGSLPSANEKSIVEFLLKLHIERRSATTLNTYLYLSRSFFNFLLHLGLISQNPTADICCVLLGNKDNRRTRPRVVRDEVQALIEKMERKPSTFSLRDETMIKIFYFTGIQTSELAGLQIEDINLRTCELVANSKLIEKRRAVKIPPALVRQLRKYLEVRWTIENTSSASYLFPNPKGGRLDRSHIYEIMNAFLNLTTATQKGAKVFRESFVECLKEGGLTRKAIRGIIGDLRLPKTLKRESR
jgi:site-specific recombinase XerD